MPQLSPHPRFASLKKRLKTDCPNHTEAWDRTAYRCVEPKWARPEYLISGTGSKTHGSRWVPPSLTPAVYAASTEVIALKEARHNFTRYGIKPRNKPRLLVDINIKLNYVVSLKSLLEDISWPSLDELLEEEWEDVNDRGIESLSQALGRAIWELSYEGIRVPSARDRRGSNLVWFPEQLRKDSSISICGKSELKKWIAK